MRAAAWGRREISALCLLCIPNASRQLTGETGRRDGLKCTSPRALPAETLSQPAGTCSEAAPLPGAAVICGKQPALQPGLFVPGRGICLHPAVSLTTPELRCGLRLGAFTIENFVLSLQGYWQTSLQACGNPQNTELVTLVNAGILRRSMGKRESMSAGALTHTALEPGGGDANTLFSS